jgi:NAD(P)-dependent dehydrogenase (short-subunit alcohol dehydrogenase family)
MRREILTDLGLNQESLAGKVALVTGAGQGIGRELAIALSMLGASVVLADIEEAGAETESLIRTRGGRALFVHADVSDERHVRDIFEKATQAFGHIDILVNNAATVAVGGITELPIRAWDRAFAVNFRGPLLLIRAILPGMLERQEGVIANVLSSEGMAYLAPYSASKAALHSLTSSLAAELGEGSGISVFNLAPGMVDTPGFNAAILQLAPRMGMTPDQFKHIGVNPGYEGLMPAEDCAAGFAYAIVHALEYHGKSADPFKPLLQAGVIRRSQEEKIGPVAPSEARELKPPREVPPERALHLSRELRDMLLSVGREIEGLDIFRKTWMKNDFSRRTGMDIKEWIALGNDLNRDLDQLTLEPDSSRAEAITSTFPYIIDRLETLAAYFSALAEESKGYFMDRETRDAAIATVAKREKIAAAMAGSLKDLMKAQIA